jgi:hypothetical protein
MSLFQKGQPKIGGRTKGTRNRLSSAFLNDLLSDYEEGGKETITFLRMEHPIEYAKMIAALLPKEFEINDNRLTEMTDDEIISFIDTIRERRAAGEGPANAGDRTSKTTH